LSSELEANQLEEYKFRFHREIETAGNLSHPNIVKILDSGETDGFAYIAMEYVDGTNLRSYARADRLLHPKTVLKIIAQCADALAYSHKQDLIHRDIKPANIIYNQADDYVKLTDFGIARIPDSTRTRAGSILGTPLYMSPEQLAGERLDARSDLYSLGVTLYHLLTGSPPFRPKTMAELMRSIAQEQHKDISEINPDTPSCIAWTVNKALEKAPDKRFQSAASMANKLRECEMMLDS
ncbi:MAG: serine/threonine protein kinase, partial [Gammaproteobacteria bacterium]|nr:serine/threonine protein kinase [Gammaproteobacteria bacterium]